MKNKTLSEKRFTSKCGWDVIQKEDVKEFIDEILDFHRKNGDVYGAISFIKQKAREL